jgi:DNA primase
MATVTVQIEWPAELGPLPEGARAWVTVEDVTALDGDSVVLAERVLDDLDSSVSPVTDVDVDDADLDPRSDVIVRVHVAPAGRESGQVEAGDLITVQSHPVLTGGHGHSVVVRPQRIGQ